MQSVSGEIIAGEANRTLQVIGQRQRGSAVPFYLVLFALILGGAAVGLGAVFALERIIGQRAAYMEFLPIVGILVGAIAYRRISQPWTTRRFRKHMMDRGLAYQFSYTFEANENGLTLASRKLRKVADWSVVTELFRVGDYWIFLVEMEPWILPSRLFDNTEEERAFVQEALSKMSLDARGRSRDAEAFVTQAGIGQ